MKRGRFLAMVADINVRMDRLEARQQKELVKQEES